MRPKDAPTSGIRSERAAYALRTSAPGTLFDVVAGSNSYSRQVPAHAPKPGYDLAIGFGVPQFAAPAAALPMPAILRPR